MDHAALINLVQMNGQPVEHVTSLMQRQCLHGAQSTLVKWTIKKGALVPLHHHIGEQITWIVEGEAEVLVQGKRHIMRAGDIIVIPPNVPHELTFAADTIDIDFFSPRRQDWIDGTDSYFQSR